MGPIQTPIPQKSYAQLRDWAGVSCKKIEEYVEAAVPTQSIPFASAFGKQAKPASMLSEEVVTTWFDAMRELDCEFCARLEHSILRSAAGQPLQKKHGASMRVRGVRLTCLPNLKPLLDPL